MQLGIRNPWCELEPAAVRAVPAQLGVYEIASASGETLQIGVAGARERFGLRSALERELAERGPGHRFRTEVNMQYQSRWRELLMAHAREHGALPPGNDDARPVRFGRLT